MSSTGAVSEGSTVRVRARVEGVVQGVGFRPYVYRLARELALGGYVLNDARGVLLEVEGSQTAAECFLERLAAEAPPLASIERVRPETILATGETAFQIRPSVHSDASEALISPDSATCSECLLELSDPDDRRYRYPFINCTNCGPRFTIATGVPYDRSLTTMVGFTMCELCRAEYEDPGDRRFHAQPNACPACGPRARLLWPDGAEHVNVSGVRGLGATDRDMPNDAIRSAALALAEGLIVAVKGVGGYHLACRADSERAVATLRERKHREDRPFALMVQDLPAAEALVELNAQARRMLEDRARPIVIAPRRASAGAADAVAPFSNELGVMLPYAPLHYLLLADFATAVGGIGDGPVARCTGDEPVARCTGDEPMARGTGDGTVARGTGEGPSAPVTPSAVALVMTSGNVSDEPIAYADEDAIARLMGIADLFLVHDRPIHMRTDDSVVRATSMGAPLPMRRSRGYVPAPIGLPIAARRPVLACGAELKSTFCLARGERAWVSHHIGDLKNYETLRSFEEGVEHFRRLFAVTPEVVAHDLHPDYLSSRFAFELEVMESIAVQHHHAHLAACLAEHGEPGPAVGAVFDGSGYGSDGTVWGGELLVGDLRDFERVGHLRNVRLPGGDRAVYQPWRMACAWLITAQEGREIPSFPDWLAQGNGGENPAHGGPSTGSGTTPERWEAIARLALSELAPLTSSAGRLFDAVAALCGLRMSVAYEGQAAIELEAAVDRSEHGEYLIELRPRDEVLELDPRAAISAIVRDRKLGIPVGTVAARFHNGLARATARACVRVAGERDLSLVALCGGVFQNRILLEATIAELERARLRPLIPRRLPAGDGGISYGQAAVAAARLS